MSYGDTIKPGAGSLVVASLFPAIVIVVELVFGLCAGAFFDPVPTIGHIVLIGFVPVANLAQWRALQHPQAVPCRLIVAGGAAAVIAASYSLLFLPMLPFALIAIIFFGIGLLPFAPVAAMVFAGRWTAASARRRPHGTRFGIGGAVLGIVALVIVDLPATATQIALGRYGGTTEDRASAVSLMRTIGDRDMLLRLSYGDTARASGVLSVLVSSWSNGPFRSEMPATGDARELYYRATGKAFNAVARPGHRVSDRMRLFGWDDDQGGEAVGGRVPELSLAASRIDGSVASRDNLGYFECTVELHNGGDIQREARFTLALPEGAVASRATLWVNGEPREASVAGRGETRAAYTSVVQTSRDPLLVTTDGAQRLLVQAFPIAPRTTMRLRIGMTAPFTIAPDGRRTLALPAIVERNFDLPADLRHAVWIEGDAPLAGPARAMISETDLLGKRPRVELPRVSMPTAAISGVPATTKHVAIVVEQRIDRVSATGGAAMLVVDTSADMAGVADALSPALDSIVAGRSIGLVVAGDTPQFVAPQPWSPTQAARIRSALASARFEGGRDDRAALAQALAAIPDATGTLLWLHGAQPIRFGAPDAALEQALERLPALPKLVRYQMTPGRALTIGSSTWFDTARLPTPSGDVTGDLRTILADVAGAGTRWAVTRRRVGGAASGSANIVRLWAGDELSRAGGARGNERAASIALAHCLNVVTPVSGAVVLETDRDYKNNGLPVPDADAVPTVPEPETWMLLILVAMAGVWLLRRQRSSMRAWA